MVESTQRQLLLSVASAALRGTVADITVRRAGRTALLNAGKELMWTGYSPEAELLKGLIVRTDASGHQAIELVAGCFGKFYNWTENVDNDRTFLAALALPGAVLTFTVKEDGSCLRPYLTDLGTVEFATRGMLRSEPGAEGYADFSGMARAIAVERYPALLDAGLVGRYTVICELIHPDNKILTNYGDRRDLVVTGLIDLATGQEFSYEALRAFCTAHDLTAVESFTVTAPTFLEAVTELRARFLGTDLEGTVASVEAPGQAVPYRLKIKGETYLALLRLARRCTMRRTRELIEGEKLTDWDSFLAALRVETPELPEEITMGYRTHFARWTTWDTENRREVAALVDAYLTLPQRDAVNQKDFALGISDDPRRSAFFSLRKLGLEAGPEALLRSVRRQRADLIAETDIEAALAV